LLTERVQEDRGPAIAEAHPEQAHVGSQAAAKIKEILVFCDYDLTVCARMLKDFIIRSRSQAELQYMLGFTSAFSKKPNKCGWKLMID
jgi:hypothetical protein